MLSRIAESLFWVGRYVERAECTARMLEVHVLRLLEDAAADESSEGRDLLAVMGVRPADDVATDLAWTMDVLGTDPTSGVSVASSLSSAREATRGAREAISSEFWESLNGAWVELGAQYDTSRRQVVAFCRWARSRCATLHGLADTTLPRDEGWLLLQLGRCLERVDMTARLLAVHSDERDPHVPVALLTAAGAHEAYLRRQAARVSLEGAMDFLLLDPQFPRGVQWSLLEAERCLRQLAVVAPARPGERDDAARAVGRVRTRLEFAEPEELQLTLPRHLQALHQAVATASAALSHRYFLRDVPLSWAPGTSLDQADPRVVDA